MVRPFRRLPQAVFLLLCALAPGALAQAPEAAPAAPVRREVPPPPVPGIEAPPEGLVPGPWETFTEGRGLRPMRRLSLTALIGFGAPIGGKAGNGSDAPNYGDISGPGVSTKAFLTYRVAPALSLFLESFFHSISGNEYMMNDAFYGPSSFLKTHENSVLGFLVGARLQIPFSHAGSLFRTGRTAEVKGLSLYATVAAGVAYLSSWQATYSDQSNTFYDFTYFQASTNPMFAAGPGFEYRWSTLAFYLDLTVQGMGKPAPSDHPDWERSTDAEDVISVTAYLGFALYF